RDENKADFGDLLFWPTWTMRHDESYRKLWAERFSCLLADEFQDTNRCQYLWLEALTRDHHELFVVGDDAQSIYGWRGANIGFIRNFCREFPNARMIALEQNFRSTGHILDAANAVIARDSGRLDKKLYTTSGQGRPIDIIRCTGAEHEAQTIVTQITQRAMAGMPYDSMALLYRYNYLSRKVEEELIRAHIPYELVNDTAFWQRATIKDALAFLSLSTRPDEWQSNDAFRRVVNVPTRGVGPKAMARIEEKAAETGFSLFAAAEALTEKATSKAGQKLRAFLDAIREIECHPDIRLAARLQMGCEMTGYAEKLRSEGEKGQVAFENLAELYDLAQGFESVEELLDHAALGSLPKADQGLGCVRLSTIHAAKGLEFEHVYLMGWEDGAFPSTTNTDQGEERRLAYVALTRAKRRAVITWVGYRYGQETAPSPFLSDFPASA
ncbi:ATP-dependent helicase, partial [Neokomagataea thailandica]